ncbi:LamG domain-containing protein [Planctomycetota bacterium]
MCSKMVHLILDVLVLCIALAGTAGAADPDLVGWWRFDEGSGTTATDFSGLGNDGTLQGDTAWVAGRYAMAVEFDGIDDFVEVPHAENLTADTEVTVMAWINTPRHMGPNDALWQGILSKSNNPRSYSFYTRDGATLHFSVGPGGAYVGSGSSASVPVPLDEWAHVCAMVIDGQHQYYVNGEDAGTGGAGTVMQGATDTDSVVIGRTGEGTGRSFLGMIDDVRIYMRGLTQEEVQGAMAGAGVPQAYGPSPADGGMHEDTWVTLSWKAGDFAVTHDVYLGDDSNVLNNATRDSDEFRGNQGATFYVAGFPGFAYPEGLVPGTIYYWRIDEINDLHPESPWKGEVWSFSIPPKKAYGPDPADGTDSVALDARLTWTPGFGAKLHTVYFGDDLETVANATVGVPSGTASYNPGPLEQEKVYYWRIDEFDGLATHKGDVWTFATTGAVGNPQPANGATNVSMATILSWMAADNAASHEVYFGLVKEAVRSADTASPEYKGSQGLGAESYDPGLLELDTTYYWRIDEVYNGNPVKGPVWTFTVGDYLLVDDFESYTDNDADGEAIWQSWIDGFGIADNGAQVGYLLPPYAEQTIIHGGSQSMPLLYTNEAGVTNSEALLTLTSPRDWTLGGVEELSLWTRGDSANAAEPLYVAISNSAGAPAVAAYNDTGAAMAGTWREWRVPLQAFADQGINLGNVDKIAIGLGSKSGLPAPGGSGTMYFDDIRLYRP